MPPEGAVRWLPEDGTTASTEEVHMTQRSIQLVDVECTASFACDSDVTMEEIRQFVADAISAKLDMAAEMADWGAGPQRFYYNGDCASDPYLAGAY